MVFQGFQGHLDFGIRRICNVISCILLVEIMSEEKVAMYNDGTIEPSVLFKHGVVVCG
jgi:hypothetical protein